MGLLGILESYKYAGTAPLSSVEVGDTLPSGMDEENFRTREENFWKIGKIG